MKIYKTLNEYLRATYEGSDEMLSNVSIRLIREGWDARQPEIDGLNKTIKLLNDAYNNTCDDYDKLENSWIDQAVEIDKLRIKIEDLMHENTTLHSEKLDLKENIKKIINLHEAIVNKRIEIDSNTKEMGEIRLIIPYKDE